MQQGLPQLELQHRRVLELPRAGAEAVAVGLTSGSGDLWLFLSLQADAVGGAVEI